MKTFGGRVLFLDRSDINTDEIIPARYLTEVDKEALGPHLLEDLKIEGFDPNGGKLKEARVVVTRANFGCGSSREHAPWALEVNRITAVFAQNYARIFRQNMFNGGMLAVELTADQIDEIGALSRNHELDCSIDLDAKSVTFTTDTHESRTYSFTLNQFDEALVRSGGWVEFADSRY